MFEINWTNKATKQLLKLPQVERARITEAAGRLKTFPQVPQVKALVNHSSDYRLRIGNYRILFAVDTAIRIVEIQDVRRRDDNTYA